MRHYSVLCHTVVEVNAPSQGIYQWLGEVKRYNWCAALTYPPRQDGGVGGLGRRNGKISLSMNDWNGFEY